MWDKIKSLFKALRTFNIWGNPPSEEVQNILNRSSAEALASDWQKIGDDIRKAMKDDLRLQ